ncbi:malto-oligosyltrehalose synthase [Streptomyces sp. ST2-7A]|uniref:malto-oligosyltrehalose synthase n=1 Tax=Streptomyces sp. ST2-7A TaxID=2907214 RepID=UPI001F48F520|nr:malto-oligosyltrehalose synthase [Streptomyces sp. ST2-7A]MCE7082280.1 malto-oligosyltrehalose synthase [Streptomyces sp. ST2-7A]
MSPDAPDAPVGPDSSRPGPPGRVPVDAPTATYRLQLQPDFPFSAAARVVPHLADLGVSHLHLSPVLEAVPGSGHGYDVVDPTRVRAELGGEEGLRELASTAAEHGLGLVLDIVPNHMAVPVPARLNRPLWETLRHGPDSPAARCFDIDWEAGDGRMLLPVLPGPIGGELASFTVERPDEGEGDGEGRGDGEAVLRHGPLCFPLRPGTEDLPMAELLEAQHYRLAWWRLAAGELNYRRFFTVNELIAVRVEDPEVFAVTHGTVLRLLAEGVVSGLRIDHPDGLADPPGYLRRLARHTGGAWTVVEKILGAGEELPGDWPVAGTTGYDALRHVDGVLRDPEGAAALTEAHRVFTGVPAEAGGEWAATERHAARRMVSRDLAAEVARWCRAAERVCRAAPKLALRDHSADALRAALVEIVAGLPVYRPYVPADGPPSATDEALLTEAARRAEETLTDARERAAVPVVRDLALGRLGGGADGDEARIRFAQLSSALRAKAAEDTAFYRYTPVLAACEVGGDPGRPTVDPEEFHAFCGRIARDWPLTGTVLSTHDAKRSADVRARLGALTEVAEEWVALLEERAREAGRPGGAELDPHTEWIGRQTALGLGAPDPAAGGEGADRHRERLTAALMKGAREAKLRTDWTDGDPVYEAALEEFTARVLCGEPDAAGAALERQVAERARVNALSATLLHLTMPGVPDLYQGTEVEYRALVDPDNRDPYRPPVDPPEGSVGAEKLRVTRRALRLRRRHPEWFGAGSAYTPLRAEGPAAAHVLAFGRGPAGEAPRAVIAVTRLSGSLPADGSPETVLGLPAGEWEDLLTGRRLTVVAAPEGDADEGAGGGVGGGVPGVPPGEGRVARTEVFGGSPVVLMVRRP